MTVAGGSALYASLTAAYLGARVTIVTSFGSDFLGLDLLKAAGVRVVATPSTITTSFENLYEGGVRRSRLLAAAEPLGEMVFATHPALRAGPQVADVALACPVFHEVTRLPVAGLIGAELQGWLRHADAHGVISPRTDVHPEIFAPCRAVFMSGEDLGHDQEDGVLEPLCEVVPIVVCTEGRAGARLFVGGDEMAIAAHPANEVDPTGAGDVFAAAFLIALAHGAGPREAGDFAARAAAIAVEGPGATALPRLVNLR